MTICDISIKRNNLQLSDQTLNLAWMVASSVELLTNSRAGMIIIMHFLPSVPPNLLNSNNILHNFSGLFRQI